MKTISRDEARQIIEGDDDVAVVEVLGPGEYQQFHLPGAVNVPLSDTFDEDIERAVPEKNKPVLVYCMNIECDAAPKAAHRLDELGYEQVFEYEAGKVDWKEAGLPVETA